MKFVHFKDSLDRTISVRADLVTCCISYGPKVEIYIQGDDDPATVEGEHGVVMAEIERALE